MKYDIIIISPFQFSNRRGVESFTYHLSNNLAEMYDLSICLYTWASNDPIDWGHWNKNIKIREVPYSRYYQIPIAKIFYWFWNKIDQPAKIICNFLWHGETVVYKKYNDILILHNPLSQIPLRYKFVKEFIDYKSLIVFDSNNSLNEFSSTNKKYTNCKMINTGVNSRYFKPEKTNNHIQKLSLICISEFEERKGIQYLIQAMPDLLSEFPSIFLTIIGSGKLKSRYKEMIDKLSIKDFVKIQDPVNDTRPYLLMSDIYFLLSDGEGFPLGLLEAMSCGIPTIVSDKPPFDEIIDKNVGCRVKREDPKSIIKAIRKLKESKVRESMGENARRLIKQRYSWPIITKQYYDLIGI